LRPDGLAGTLGRVAEEQGIYRGEVTTMMIALADINFNVRKILAYIQGEDGNEEEEEEAGPPDA
jgi:hypothetical protein